MVSNKSIINSVGPCKIPGYILIKYKLNTQIYNYYMTVWYIIVQNIIYLTYLYLIMAYCWLLTFEIKIKSQKHATIIKQFIFTLLMIYELISFFRVRSLRSKHEWYVVWWNN